LHPLAQTSSYATVGKHSDIACYFLVIEIFLKTQAENVNPGFSWAVWFTALNNISPEPGYAVRQSLVLLLLSDHSEQYNEKESEPSVSDASQL